MKEYVKKSEKACIPLYHQYRKVCMDMFDHDIHDQIHEHGNLDKYDADTEVVEIIKIHQRGKTTMIKWLKFFEYESRRELEAVLGRKFNL